MDGIRGGAACPGSLLDRRALMGQHARAMIEAGLDEAGEAEAMLLTAFAAGDRVAARRLADRLVPRALSLAFRMLADRAEAEDVTQEAMMRLWRAAPDWRTGEGRVSTWLHRVVVNLCIDRLRRRRETALAEVPEPPDPATPPAERLDQAARLRALSDALAGLPERQAQAVALRHLEGLSNPEIAAIMGIGVEAVESLTARGRRALAAALAGRKAELGYED
ncbi:RNA polymerase, sigma subunit, ECF family [Rubellimicrobium thermophilum DSM 16684]|uniref:RNA polymerase, sigma subunit, ECF family n=2 Tax=Rubellimicrobium TaxID=295418 RepID=S9SLK6_9RHOB|nr:RNA polymerase, sigma subunit, ECF family [Rubellimicrobium thermophilum DSM 16684]